MKQVHLLDEGCYTEDLSRVRVAMCGQNLDAGGKSYRYTTSYWLKHVSVQSQCKLCKSALDLFVLAELNV